MNASQNVVSEHHTGHDVREEDHIDRQTCKPAPGSDTSTCTLTESAQSKQGSPKMLWFIIRLEIQFNGAGRAITSAI